jgi:uncharacterized protein (TIGR02757 family)
MIILKEILNLPCNIYNKIFLRENITFMTREEKDLKIFLDQKVIEFNSPDFIASDPISIPHKFTKKEDIEIAGFLIATIAWGGRKAIIKSGEKFIKLMDYAPFDFIHNFEEKDLLRFKDFVYRTFNSDDMIYFLTSLQNIYKNHKGIEEVFTKAYLINKNIGDSIEGFRNTFFELEHLKRTERHVSSPMKSSAAKRLNMYLRWMVRNDKKGVDFGIWNKIGTSDLLCPLDVHSSRVARKLGLLQRKSNDWKAAIELTDNLKKLDSEDPVKYDFALFGLGVFEKFGI